MLPEEFRTAALAEMEAVYRLACHLARNQHEADDAAQETYLRAFRSAATFRPVEDGMRPWLFKILHNVLNSRLSKEQREHAIAEAARQESVAAPTGTKATGPTDGHVDWDSVDQRLKVAIEELSLPHRTVFLLAAVEGLGYREIASVMEIPIGTVMSRLSRARTILSARLAELGAEHGLGRDSLTPNIEPERPT